MRWVARHEVLHDLCLERDVGDALSRPVVHLARDLTTHLFLGGHHIARCRAAATQVALGSAGVTYDRRGVAVAPTQRAGTI